MELFKALTFANDLLRKYSEELPGWSFDIDYRAKHRRLGYCHYGRKTISCTDSHIIRHSDSSVKNTILHELAHALAYVRHGESGHGAGWKRICREVGATPERLSSDTAERESKYIAKCETCFRYYRRNTMNRRKIWYCTACRLKNLAKPLVWTISPSRVQEVKMIASKIASGSVVQGEVDALVDMLAIAHDRGDRVAARKIRAQLRKKGHKGGLK